MSRKLLNNLLFPLVEALRGTSIRECLKFLNKTQWWKREQIEELQNKKLRLLINHAYNNVPYYHDLFKKLNLRPEDIRTREDLSKLPFLTKDIIRKNLEKLLAVNIDKSKMIELHSSGTTGEPMKFYIDKRSYSYGWAQTFRSWSWAGFSLGDRYVKLDIDVKKNVTKRFEYYLMNCLYFGASDLEESKGEKILREIKKFNPKIIRGYTSMVYLLSKYIEFFGIDGIRPNAVSTTGEKLFPHYRESIEKNFNCKVLDSYGGEATPLAFQCGASDKYHVCEETAILEIVRDNSPASPGELGEIVFTNLENYAMPFIRYKIGDVGIPAEDYCECGRTLACIETIEGRVGDIVIMPNGTFLVPNFFTSLFKDFEGVVKFQVIQKDLYNIIIKIVKDDRLNMEYLNNAIKKIKDLGGGELNVDVEFTDSIPPAKSGKYRFVISKVPIDLLWER